MPEGAAGGERPGREAPGIAVPAHLGQRDRRDRRGGRDRRAADRAERARGEHRRHREAAAEAPITTLANSNSAFEMPPCDAKLPIRMKSGITDRS
jgi:hypothetical protein